jgi:hypothetical protein
MKELQLPTLTNRFTKVFHEDVADMKFGAPHHFTVTSVEVPTFVVGQINFQEGPCKEVGVNGVANEDLLNMVLIRLRYFQTTKYACEENAQAIREIEYALASLFERTNKREERNVLGTSGV